MSDVFQIWVIERKRNSSKYCIKQVLSEKGCTCYNRDSRCEVSEKGVPTGVVFKKGEWFKTFNEASAFAEKLIQDNIKTTKRRYEKAIEAVIISEPIKYFYDK